MRERTKALLSSKGVRQSLVLALAMLIAGALDYLFNIVAGRRLEPAEYGVLIAVAAILQVMVYLTNVIRNVTARYTAEMTVDPDADARTAAFIRQRWRWALRWGLVAMVVMAVLSLALARLLKLDSPLPLWAASLALLLLFLRPVTDGALQGLQQFAGLGLVQILQALLRLLIAIALIALGWQAFGAVLALPLASTGALLVALWLLRSQFRATDNDEAELVVSWQYSLLTLVGLLAFAMIVNMDAIVVKLSFSPESAGNYAPLVTLGKIILFLPLAIGLVLFPKAAQRQAAGRDPRPILVVALAATLVPGLVLSLLFFLLPGLLVEEIFGSVYDDPGSLLGMVGLATTLYATLNIWLNYALSLDRSAFVYALVGTLMLQLVGMALFHDTLYEIVTVMVVTGVVGNVLGILTSREPVASAESIRYT